MLLRVWVCAVPVEAGPVTGLACTAQTLRVEGLNPTGRVNAGKLAVPSDIRPRRYTTPFFSLNAVFP
jgi:hypothetical protein